MRKPRSDSSPLDPFADQLDQWLAVENLSYDAALKRLLAIWPAGTPKPSRSSLQRWNAKRQQERVLQRITRTATAANAVTDAFRANPADTFGALLNIIGQGIFEHGMAKGDALDIATLKDLAELVQVGLKARHDEATLRIKQEQVALQERRVALLEKQAAEATDVLEDGAMTPEQKMARMREVFGLK